MTDAAVMSWRQAGAQVQVGALGTTLSDAPDTSGQPFRLSITVALIPEVVQSLQSIPRHVSPPSGEIVLYGRRLPCNRQQARLSNLSIV